MFKPLSPWDWNSSREVRERGWGEGVTEASSKVEPDKAAAKAAASQSIPRSIPVQFFQLAQDGFQYRLGALQDVVVPEAQDALAARLEIAAAFGIISGLFEMLPAVGFHHQFRPVTDEIAHIRTNRFLTAEFAPAQATVAQVIPQFAFGVGHLLALFFGMGEQAFFMFQIIPSRFAW